MIFNCINKIFSLIKTWVPQTWKPWLVIVASFIIILGHTGLWVMPNISAQFAVSQSLFVNPFSDPNAQYIFTNYLQPFLFGVFGGNSFFTYILYALIVSICFILLFLLWFIRFHGEEVAIQERKLLLVILFPVFMVPLYWVGMDGMTLLLMLIVMINFSSKWVIIPAMLLSWQHFEQGFVSLLILFGTIVLSIIFNYNKAYVSALKNTSCIIGGLILGKLLIMLNFYLLNINMSGDRLTSMKSNAIAYIDNWKLFWPYILFSLLGVCWYFIFIKFKNRWPLLVGVIIAFFILLVIGDQTRVGCIILFPSIFYWIFMDKDLWISFNYKNVIFFVAIYLIIPVFYVWGFLYSSLITYDLMEIRSIQKTGISIMQSDPIKPFKRD